MLLTIYYMATTWFQSYRLSNIKSKLKKFLSNNLTLVVYKERDYLDFENENLCIKETTDIFLSLRPRGISSDSCKNARFAQLDQVLSIIGHKRSCSVLPEQILNVDSWIFIPSNQVTFPVHLNTRTSLNLNLESKLHFLIEANYRMFDIHQNIKKCLIEDFGVPKAWNAGEHFGLLLESDLDHFTKLASNFMADTKPLYLGNHMELLRIQTVKVEGQPCDINNHESIASNINFVYSLQDNYGINSNLTSIQWKNYCDTLHAVSVAATNVLKYGKPIHFCSAILSRDTENEINMEDYVVIDNVPDEVDSTIVKSIQSEYFTENKIEKNTFDTLQTSNENHLQYVRFNNECEFNNELNGKSNGEYHSESSSNTSSSESINFRRIVLTPIGENEVKLSSGIKPIKSSPDLFGIYYKNSLNSSMMRSHRSFSDFSNGIETKTRCHTPVQHSGEMKTGKPPNIIIYSESASSAQQIQHLLESVLHRYRYTIYILSLEKMLHSPWTSQATMVVIYGAVPDELYPLLEYYLLTEGGRILCLCSDFLGTFLPTAFSTTEVRSDDVVNLTYHSLSLHTSLLHHVLCYQPSTPNNDHFPSENGVKEELNLDVVDMFDTNNKYHAINIKVLAAEDTWETPSLILATAPSGGKVIFSQVHLEIDYHQKGVSSSTENRYLLIKDLLSTHLGLDCISCEQEPKHTPAYLLGTENNKVKFLTSLNGKVTKNNILLLKDLKVQFCTKDEMCIGVSEYSLPVICDDFPMNFNEEEYFKNLHTEELGRLVIFGEVMSSSMKLLNDPISRHGLVVIPKQQITGIGRGGNKWLSPNGCAMFSVQLHIPFDSKLGQRLALLQHVVALSVVSAICSLPGGYDKLDLGLKWPNDIYAGGNAKIGGLVISSSAAGSTAICSIGCGVNLNNSLPTTCINDIIVEHNATTHSDLKTLTFEQYFGVVFTELERLLNQVQNGNVDIIFDLYYKYWLHSNTLVTVLRPNKSSFKATIIGLDDHGFLRVRSEDGEILDVRPDGNSFDMLAGLIAPK